MKSNSVKVWEILVNNPDKPLARKELAFLSGVPLNRISDCIYRIINIFKITSVYPVNRGVWVFSRDRKYPEYESPATRLHTFINESGSEGVTVDEIADAFDIPVTQVPSLLGRMVTALGTKPKKVVRYTFHNEEES